MDRRRGLAEESQERTQDERLEVTKGRATHGEVSELLAEAYPTKSVPDVGRPVVKGSFETLCHEARRVYCDAVAAPSHIKSVKNVALHDGFNIAVGALRGAVARFVGARPGRGRETTAAVPIEVVLQEANPGF